MSKITFTPNAAGTGTFNVVSPNSNSNRTITLPDSDITLGQATPSIDDNGNATAITIDSSENVGIGTASTGGHRLRVEGGTTYLLDHMYIAGGTGKMISSDSTSNPLIFGRNASEDMRIDGGNLLVGGTTYEGSTASNASSSYLGQNGFISSNVTDDFGMQVNRTGTDGTLFNFRKNGADVGSIGVDSGDNITFGATSGGGSGLFMFGAGGTSPFILPMKEGALSDNTVTLGDDSRRFKDLYLSGGVFLGGTGAANKLDDYEEGTWTPVLRGNSGTPSGQVYSNQHGTYTKIGRSVHVQAYVSVTNMGSGTYGTYGILTGLPFNVASGPQYYASASFPYIGALGQNVNSLHGYGQHNSDFVYVMYQNGASIASSYLSPAGWGSTPTIMFGMTYFTDA